MINKHRIISTQNTKLKNNIILQYRIYPAIQYCLKNRIRIVIGSFAFYSSILTISSDILSNYIKCYLLLFYSMFIAILIIINYINYFDNAKEQLKLENKAEFNKYKVCNIEYIFGISTLCANLLVVYFMVYSIFNPGVFLRNISHVVIIFPIVYLLLLRFYNGNNRQSSHNSV